MRRSLFIALAVLATAVVFPAIGSSPAAAAAFPPGLTDNVVAGGLGAPTAVAALPDGRMLVTSQEGKLWVVATSGATSVAIDFAALGKICSEGEQGLLGVTVDPQFATNGLIYVYYTARVGSCVRNGANPNGAKNRVSRFTMSESSVSAGSEQILLDNMPVWGSNHNGGDVRVANDGTLFVTVGDGGGGSPASNPSDLSLPNGKVLRIGLDGTIPAGNPYGATTCRTAWGPPGAPQVCGEIWADGLRNPFRLGFDVSAPGAKFRINDVGDGTWEEVDDASPGAHYGWPCREGPSAHASSAPCRTPTSEPALYYNHSTGCNVISGGAFVPVGAWPGYEGSYLFVDFGCGLLWLAQPGTTGAAPAPFASGLQQTTDLEFLASGGEYALFYTTYAGGGQLHRVTGAPAGGGQPSVGASSSGPAVASWGDGRLDVFVRGVDGQLWHRWFDGEWRGWEPLGGVLASGPAVASWGGGRLDVFVRGVDGQLWHRWFDGEWRGWEPLGGVLASGPAVASWGGGRLDVFVRGVDGQLWHRWFDGEWRGWEPLGGVLASGPAVASWGGGRLDVFVRGVDGQLWHRWFDGEWRGWEPLGGVLASGPGAASWGGGRLDVFVRGVDGQLWHRWFDGEWRGWEPLGGVLASGPGAASWGGGRLDVFVRGVDGQLWHRWFDGEWRGWEPLGGVLSSGADLAS